MLISLVIHEKHYSPILELKMHKLSKAYDIC